MARFRKRPVEVEAVQWTGKNAEEVVRFLNTGASLTMVSGYFFDDLGLAISTREGTMKADVDDWIIKGVKGEFYPCKPDIFAQTYEEVL